MKQRLLLIISLAIGLTAGILTFFYLRAKDLEVQAKIAEIRRRSEPIPVIAAARDLPKGSVIEPEDIGEIDVPASAVRGHHMTRDDRFRLYGRKTMHPLSFGAPILWSDIEGGKPGVMGLSSDIRHGMRAVSINVSGAAAVSGMVRPMDRIDVIGTFSFPSPTHPGEMELVTMTMLQDVSVIATGRDTARTISSVDQRTGGIGQTYNTVTLEVTPREANVLVFVEQAKGRLSLALRNPADPDGDLRVHRVNFEDIEGELKTLNEYRQRTLLDKRLPE